jgi:hypothetical protein
MPRATLFGRLVDLVEGHELRTTGLRQHLGDGGGQGGLAVVDVTDGPDVEVRLVTDEFLFGHGGTLPRRVGCLRRRTNQADDRI